MVALLLTQFSENNPGEEAMPALLFLLPGEMIKYGAVKFSGRGWTLASSPEPHREGKEVRNKTECKARHPHLVDRRGKTLVAEQGSFSQDTFVTMFELYLF